MNAKISVIVPVYNTGTILKKTLLSIKNQTFNDFECLLVDDGTKDSITVTICEDFAQQDSRFKYLKKENEGIEKTRLFGVSCSTADLLVFCDHDDYYEINAFELLYKNWEHSHADVIVGNCYFQQFKNIPIRKRNYNLNKNVVISRGEFVNAYYKNFFGINVFPVSTWGKLYSKHLFLKELKCFGYNFFEDTVLNAQIFDRVTNVHFIPEFIYTHIYGGLSSRFDGKKVLMGYMDIYEMRIELLKKNNIDSQLKKSLLVEFKNVITVNSWYMMENNYSEKEYLDVMNIISDSIIFKEAKVENVFDKELADFYLNNDFKRIYGYYKNNFDLKRKIKSVVKNAIKRILA